MIDGKIIGVGHDGVTYKMTEGSALKLFYEPYRFPISIEEMIAKNEWESEKDANTEFQNLLYAYGKNIPVPQPYSIEKIELDKADIANIESRLKKSNVDTYNYYLGWNANHIEAGRSVFKYGIKRQFIDGKNLYDKFFFPNPTVIKKVKNLHKLINEAGLIYPDTKANNYVIDKKGKIFIVDAKNLRPNETGWTGWMNGNGSTCKLGEWAMIIKENLEADLF